MDIPHPINATGSRNRNHSLDVFRLISVFVIFLFHSEMHLSCNYYIFENFIKMGAIFMTAFFMLSGVVHETLEKPAVNFLKKRLL